MQKKILFLLCIFFTFGLQGKQTDDVAKPAKRQTICLNMIVKNESQVIERCLGSLKHLIDYWVIYDTGSTDGTQEIIKNFMKDIPGELHESAWVDFAHNRNEALASAKGKADYLLLIDADEILKFSDEFTLPNLDKDFYYITVRQVGAADIKRTGLVNNHIDWKWQGVLHEVIESPQAKTYAVLKDVLNICNTAVGARSKDPKKYLKDALVFEKALKKDPTNSRYAFYLAQSYLNAEKYDLAKNHFEKRIAMESQDVQETYMAIYNLGCTQEKLNDFDAALQTYFKAYEYRPTRAEPLFKIATIYRKKGNYLLGYLISKHALSIPYPKDDLCVEYMTYDYALLIEFANCTLLTGRFQEGLQACCQLLANPNLPEDIKTRVVGNCELARKKVYGDTPAATPQ
jgi:glycosyltransferase involved in cell wall biosynthesis